MFLDEVTATDFTATQVEEEIKNGFQEVVTSAMEVYEGYYVEKWTTDTVADQQEYALPSDFFKTRRVEINYDADSSNSVASRAIPIDIDQIRFNLDNTNIGPRIGANPRYYIWGNNLGFVPIPDKSSTADAITLWYVKQVANPTSFTSSDNPDIPYHNRYCYLITLKAAANLLRKGQQESVEADKLDVKFEAGLTKMKQQLESRIAEESKSVIDVNPQMVDFGEVF